MMYRFVIIGSGLAGHTAALELSRLNVGTVCLLGEEQYRPYDRPPLSKDFLLGPTNDISVPYLSKPNDYSDKSIRFRPSTKVTKICREEREILTEEGNIVPYDRLLLAVGSSAVKLPCTAVALEGVHTLRTYEDAKKLRAALTSEKHLVIIGGGLIGLEVAAAARAKKMKVTILEAGDRLAARSLPADMSQWLYDLHYTRGCSIELRQKVVDISRTSNCLQITTDSQRLEADEVLVCIGVRPNAALALDCGLDVRDGIVVDQSCRTIDEAIFAAGEVTNYPVSPWNVGRRMECWKTSCTQPLVASRVMAGDHATYKDVPWFWSDQFDCSIQVIGLPDLAIETRIWDDPAPGTFGMTCIGTDGRIVAAAGVNCGRRISMLRKEIENQQRF